MYVVDSSDRARFVEAKEELWSVLADDRLRNTVLVVLANKQDMPEAATVAEVTNALDLPKLRSRWFVQGCCAVNGEGLIEGFTVLADAVKEEQKKAKVSPF